ncbi:MAG TPA: response regulator, partial [Ktedonobacterales bacterium]
MKILIADSDREFVTILSYWLRSHGHTPLVAQDASELLTLWRERSPELILLDFALRGVKGPQFCQRLRQERTGLIMVLTNPCQVEEEARALEQGADDYLAKPVSLHRLQAHINALGRRPRQGIPAASSTSQFRIGSTLFNPAQSEVIRNGRHLRLTPLEGRLLHLLFANAGQVLPVSLIVQRIWGYEHGQINLIKTHIHNLRQKIEPDPSRPCFLLTLPSVGYVLHLQEQTQPEASSPDAEASVRSATFAHTRRASRGKQRMPSVLIVDDDEEIRVSLRLFLEDEGYRVAEALDGEEALTLLRRRSERRVVLLDHLMPVLDGTGVLRTLQAEPALAQQHTFILITALPRLPLPAQDLSTLLGVP